MDEWKFRLLMGFISVVLLAWMIAGFVKGLRHG